MIHDNDNDTKEKKHCYLFCTRSMKGMSGEQKRNVRISIFYVRASFDSQLAMASSGLDI